MKITKQWLKNRIEKDEEQCISTGPPSLEDFLNDQPKSLRYWVLNNLHIKLPFWYTNESLRTFTFQLFDCSVTHKSLTKLHRFDILINNHRKWWQPKYIGFTIWH